eukprot:6380324-Pyramimonas_sp.AAC.1
MLCQLRDFASDNLEIVSIVEGRSSPKLWVSPSFVEVLGDAADGFPRTPALFRAGPIALTAATEPSASSADPPRPPRRIKLQGRLTRVLTAEPLPR